MAHGGEQQRDGKVCDGCRIRSDCVCYLDAPGAGGFQIDAFVAGAETGNDLEVWKAIHQLCVVVECTDSDERLDTGAGCCVLTDVKSETKFFLDGFAERKGE
jgi:hypothetical protein